MIGRSETSFRVLHVWSAPDLSLTPYSVHLPLQRFKSLGDLSIVGERQGLAAAAERCPGIAGRPALRSPELRRRQASLVSMNSTVPAHYVRLTNDLLPRRVNRDVLQRFAGLHVRSDSDGQYRSRPRSTTDVLRRRRSTWCCSLESHAGLEAIGRRRAGPTARRSLGVQELSREPLQSEPREFADRREWGEFHPPKNLVYGFILWQADEPHSSGITPVLRNVVIWVKRRALPRPNPWGSAPYAGPLGARLVVGGVGVP